jgi:uncharacterized protein
MAKIEIQKLTNMNVYVDGANFLARASEITLPNIKDVMADHKGLGMFGKAQVPSGIDMMEMTIKWVAPNRDVMVAFSDPRQAPILQCRGSLETHNSAGLLSEVPVVAEFVGRRMEHNLGSAKKNEPVEPETKLAVTYYKLTIDGEEIMEIDVLENIYKVDGVDILATYRRNVGA